MNGVSDPDELIRHVREGSGVQRALDARLVRWLFPKWTVRCVKAGDDGWTMQRDDAKDDPMALPFVTYTIEAALYIGAVAGYAPHELIVATSLQPPPGLSAFQFIERLPRVIVIGILLSEKQRRSAIAMPAKPGIILS